TAGHLEEDVAALADVALAHLDALLLVDEVLAVAVQDLGRRADGLDRVLVARDVPVDRRDRQPAHRAHGVVRGGAGLLLGHGRGEDADEGAGLPPLAEQVRAGPPLPVLPARLPRGRSGTTA